MTLIEKINHQTGLHIRAVINEQGFVVRGFMCSIQKSNLPTEIRKTLINE